MKTIFNYDEIALSKQRYGDNYPVWSGKVSTTCGAMLSEHDAYTNYAGTVRINGVMLSNDMAYPNCSGVGTALAPLNTCATPPLQPLITTVCVGYWVANEDEPEEDEEQENDEN